MQEPCVTEKRKEKMIYLMMNNNKINEIKVLKIEDWVQNQTSCRIIYMRLDLYVRPPYPKKQLSRHI